MKHGKPLRENWRQTKPRRMIKPMPVITFNINTKTGVTTTSPIKVVRMDAITSFDGTQRTIIVDNSGDVYVGWTNPIKYLGATLVSTTPAMKLAMKMKSY